MLDQQINCLIKKTNIRSTDQQNMKHINYQILINISKVRPTNQKLDYGLTDQELDQLIKNCFNRYKFRATD